MAEPRRSLLRWLLGGGLTASIASFLYPAVRFMSPPNIPEAAVHEAAAGKVDDLGPNSGRIVRFGTRPVLLIRVSDTEWRAFEGTCTHLDCTVQFRQDTHQIWCACHNGFYDLQGRVVSGPPPRPLDQYAVHIRGEEVIITRRT